MTHYARLLSTLYAATALWLAWLTVQTWGQTPTWVSLLNTAASITAVCAGFRESEHADDLRDLRAELERAARPDHGDPLVIPPSERAEFERITAGLDPDDHDSAA